MALLSRRVGDPRPSAARNDRLSLQLAPRRKLLTFEAPVASPKQLAWKRQHKMPNHQPKMERSQLGEFSGLGCCDKLGYINSLLAIPAALPTK